MLAADQRLRRATDFAVAIKRGRRAARDGLVVHLFVHGEPGPVRAGFVVPKAVGSAVTRNTVRRRLRHLVRDELGQLGPGTDVVIRVLPSAAGRSSAELGSQLRAALGAASRTAKTRTADSSSLTRTPSTAPSPLTTRAPSLTRTPEVSA